MQATITFCLTEAAQRAQMVATGQPVARKQTVTVDVPAEDLEYYPILPTGAIVLNLCTSDGLEGDLRALRAYNYEFTAAPHVPDLVRKWRGLIQAIETAIVGSDALLAEKIDALPPERQSQGVESRIRRMLDTIAIPKCPPEINPRYSDSALRAVIRKLPLAVAADERWVARSREAIGKQDAAIAAERAAKIAADTAAEAAKQDAIAAWVESLDSEFADLKAQFADGLACRKALLSMMADVAFAAAGIGKGANVPSTCANRECPCCDTTLDCLPGNVYSAWRALKSGLPAGAHVAFSYVRECQRDEDWDGEGDSAGPAYYTADIAMPYGPFTFSRRVRLG